MTFHVSNLGERRVIVDPVLRCVSANRIDEGIVDYEEPFHVWIPTIEGQLEASTTIGELGGVESATFSISDTLDGSWLDEEPVFLPPDDERVERIEFRFGHGLNGTGFGADRSSIIPTYHIIGDDNLVSLQPVAEIATFCQLTILDPVTGREFSEGFAIWQIGGDVWRGGRASLLYDVLGTRIYVSGPGGTNETDPELCESDSPPFTCITGN